MKAKELMIGDWVCYCRPKRYITQVQEIRRTTDRSYIVCIRDDRDPMKEERYYDDFNTEILHPIPLTPEILQKNGFMKSGSYYIMSDDYHDVIISEINDSIWDVQYTSCEMSVDIGQAHVCHVHQLQHAFRLFGIDKEIEPCKIDKKNTVMKACTDLEQSKKLAEVLPIESADMGWNVFADDSTRILPIDDWDLIKDGKCNVQFYPAWSLSALMDFLPSVITRNDKRMFLTLEKAGAYNLYYKSPDRLDEIWFTKEKIIDAAFEMIAWLKEQEEDFSC